MSWKKKNRVHAVPTTTDSEMAAAMGFYVNALCGYRWIPEKFADECAGMARCEECFPPQREKKTRGPRPSVKVDVPTFVYRCFDGDGRLIYVGCTKNPPARMASHRKNSWWFPQVVTTRMVVFPDRAYALLQERKAIAAETPRWNVKCKWAYRTDAWRAEDYIDFRHAIVQAIDTTHGVYTDNTKKRLAEIDDELEARFGITAITRRSS